MLQVSNLSRKFGDKLAVDDVSFDVPSGQMTGFVGANGAGKTTTMRMIMGVLSATSGEVLLDGAPLTALARSTFGYMPEERGLYPKQPILDQLIYLGQLHRMSQSQARKGAMDLLERFGLGGRTKDKLESLSLGNQQRVQIAASLLHKPNVLILDEPFSGLDPVAVDSMVELLRERTSAGVPVLFSSHQLDLVDRLCDSMVVLQQGKDMSGFDLDGAPDFSIGTCITPFADDQALAYFLPGILYNGAYAVVLAALRPGSLRGRCARSTSATKTWST